MDMSKFNLDVIYTREDGSYVINNGLYHVPNEGQYAELWAAVDAEAKAHPEKVQPEPQPEPYTPPEPTPAEKADAVVGSAIREHALQEYDYTTEQYATLVAGGAYEEFDAGKEYPDGYRVVYDGNLYTLTEDTTGVAPMSTDVIVIGKYRLTLLAAVE